ncbi:general substrate transporter [Aspergillus ambiguus]|uniref:general substrate transporter n=1 Tax=Aspergillus ambiguus TaxID=176160 RepID=UPI003CCD8659
MHTDTNPNRQWNWKNFWICLLLSCGQIAFGYPSSIISTTLAQPSFLLYMKLVDEKGDSTPHSEGLIGATSGVFQAGAFFGILLGSWVMDKYGRRVGVVYCAVLSIVGGTCMAASQNIGMFIAFRFFAGAGSWAFLALTPVYTSELSPPRLRGLFVGMNGVGICIGYAIAAYMGLAFYSADNPSAQWRGPLGISLIFPVFMLLLLFILPESPRWLLMNGYDKEARKIVMDLHRIGDSPEQLYAQEEFYQMKMQSEHDRALEPSWKEMFIRASYRKRVILACAFAFIGQSTAILVINNYGPTLYAALGYGTADQLKLQCAAIMDRLGRRPLMIFGVSACCVCLIIEAAIISIYASPIPANPNTSALAMGVAAFYIFLAVYSVGIDVCGTVFYSELFPNHIRSKGCSLAIAALAITDLVYLQATTTAFANIGWKFFLVFIIISGLGAIYLFIYLPETKGVPLEEMAAKFGDDADVAVFMSDVHANHATHELAYHDRHPQGSVQSEELPSAPSEEDKPRVSTEEHKKASDTQV